jgi:hypothetical protein
MLYLEDNALYQHIITTHEESEKKLNNENSRLKAMLNVQDHSPNSDGEPPKKKRREEVPILKTDLDGKTIQRKGSAEVE